MENKQPHLERFEIGGSGIGEVSRKTLENRALELARMDGRDMWNKGDLTNAEKELSQSWQPGTEPELVDSALETLVVWDEPAQAGGSAVPRTPIENETNLSEILTQEGIEEAEHDRRVAYGESREDGTN